MMEIQIHSIRSLKQLAQTPFAPETCLISIGDVGEDPPVLEHPPEHILQLNFDDISPAEFSPSQRQNQSAFSLFSWEQAQQIAEFVYRYKDTAPLLLCQCHYGQSRSAAVAAAVLEHFYHNGIDVFADEQERYCPNIYVFRKTLQALGRKGEERRNDAL